MIERKTLPTQLHTGKRPLKNRFENPQNYGGKERRSGFMKPPGGLWTSTWETAFDVGWPSWCLGEDFRTEQFEEAWLLEPVECRVIELAGFDQCHEFMKRYAKELHSWPKTDAWESMLEHDPDSVYRRAHEAFNTPSMACPVWTEVAKDADCVRLLTPYAFDVRLGPYLFFNTWDCESTIWLRWRFKGAARRVDLTPQLALHNGREEGEE